MKEPSAQDDKVGLLLKSHRKTVASSKGMSSAVLLGSSFAFAMGLFALLGHRWDEKHDSEPLGVLVGVSLGLLYGGYEVWKVVRVTGAEPSRSVKGEAEEPSRPSKGDEHD
ncbi:AtpZ/AtpI family protein [Kiritimatiellaeota bacterium B1221]|nr:AtpZ/AtpI family protein [Kiritimatiellaeota bacterium B1221]